MSGSFKPTKHLFPLTKRHIHEAVSDRKCKQTVISARDKVLLVMAYYTRFQSSSFKTHTNDNGSICQTLAPFLDMQIRENLPDFYVITAIAACALSVITSCATLLLNTIVILATCLTPSLRHEPKNILLCSLAVADFFVGLLSQPSFLTAEISLILGKMEQYCYAVFIHFYASWIFSGISFLTLSAISIERYLAIRFHLRYGELITATSVVSAVIIYWLIWVSWITVLWFGVQDRLLSYFLIVLCILIAIADGFCYFNIFKAVRRHNLQIKRTLHDRLDMARYRRTTNTMLFLVSAFAGSYLPFAITSGTSALQDKEDMRTSAAHCMAVAFVSASSCINPLIYFWRVSEFREAAKHTLRRIHLMRQVDQVETNAQTNL